MELRVNERISLTEIRASDKAAIVRLAGDKKIYRWTLRIPHPYGEKDFDEWLVIVEDATEKYGRPVTWAIRDETDQLIGVVGVDGVQLEPSFCSHRGEIGYWLGRPYWKRGIMTAVLPVACEHCRREFGLKRITANVFAENMASRRVLEKCGFVCEAPVLRKAYFKSGQYLDGRLYALVT